MDNIFVQLGQGLRAWLEGLGASPSGVEVWMDVLGIIGALVFILCNALFLIFLERKLSAFIQLRFGPNRLGPKGLFQTIADVLKLLGKEDIVPSTSDKAVFILSSLLIFTPTLLAFAVIPYGDGMIISDLNIGIFFFISVSSTATVAFLMAGWGSGNKYSLIGGMRTIAQMISYEIPLAFSLLGVIMIVGSLNLSDIVEAQNKVWFILPQFIGFMVYLIASHAELNRAPFDLPEGEQELVAGVFTEFSGMRYALFFLAEYANLVASCSIAVTLFLGGWHAPFGLDFIPSYLWYVWKVYFLIFIFMLTRWTFPRIRIDHLMNFSWKFLIPVSLFNILITGVGIKIYQMMGW